jgi:osmoprotectant transport system ATP-binding protein
VDSFVASFVGRDRGYRALGFSSAGNLKTHDEPTVRLGSVPTAAEVDRSPDGWLLVVDDQGAPQGWLRLADLSAGEPVREQSLHLGGTLASQGGSFRAALDACLSSPTGRGVVVDGGGALLGTVTATEVLTLIEQRSADSGEPR